MESQRACVAAPLDGAFAAEGVRVPTSAEGVRHLHSWQGGAYGELLVGPGQDPAPRPRSVRDEQALASSSHVLLTLAEAFYLAFHRCDTLRVWPHGAGAAESGEPLTAAQAWACFSCAAPRFAYELAAYTQLRDSGWIVRSGLKFGADFALYAPAATHAHAALCASVSVAGVDPPHDWRWLQRHVRLCSQVAKGFALCEVEHGGGALDGPACLPRMAVRLLRVASWMPGKAHAALSAASRAEAAPHDAPRSARETERTGPPGLSMTGSGEAEWT